MEYFQRKLIKCKSKAVVVVLIETGHCTCYFYQVQLQNMLTSKFIDYFLEEVSSWQKKLSTADTVITIWMEVQRTWSHLESIFIGSEDIRKQLPEDSDRFDKIDFDFKVISGAM